MFVYGYRVQERSDQAEFAGQTGEASQMPEVRKGVSEFLGGQPNLQDVSVEG
jgi:hypothetical protein